MAGLPVYSTSIQTLSITYPLKKALAEAGYNTVEEIQETTAEDLATELGIIVSQAEDILKECQAVDAGPSSSGIQTLGRATQPHGIQSATAAELLSSDNLPHFSTLSHNIDNLISTFSHHIPSSSVENGEGSGKGKGRAYNIGSVHPGMVVELSGPPGIGKTSLAIGLMMSARLGKRDIRDEAEEGNEVLVIDTEGSITPDRIYHAAECLTRASSISPKSVVRGIHIVRIPTQVQMIAFLETMDDWLDAHPDVNLVIIDTLSYHFRQPGLDSYIRRRAMDTVKQKIAKATTIHKCAVIVINQLATKMFTAENKQGNFENGEKAVLMPQLGESWTTAKTLRLALFRGPPGDDLPYCHASTSANGSLSDKWACFDIDSDGLPIDVPDLEPDQPE